MDLEKKTDVIESIIDEYLKPTPNEEDVKKLMQKLDIDHVEDGLANMKAVLNCLHINDTKSRETPRF